MDLPHLSTSQTHQQNYSPSDCQHHQQPQQQQQPNQIVMVPSIKASRVLSQGQWQQQNMVGQLLSAANILTKNMVLPSQVQNYPIHTTLTNFSGTIRLYSPTSFAASSSNLFQHISPASGSCNSGMVNPMEMIRNSYLCSPSAVCSAYESIIESKQQQIRSLKLALQRATSIRKVNLSFNYKTVNLVHQKIVDSSKPSLQLNTIQKPLHQALPPSSNQVNGKYHEINGKSHQSISFTPQLPFQQYEAPKQKASAKNSMQHNQGSPSSELSSLHEQIELNQKAITRLIRNQSELLLKIQDLQQRLANTIKATQNRSSQTSEQSREQIHCKKDSKQVQSEQLKNTILNFHQNIQEIASKHQITIEKQGGQVIATPKLCQLGLSAIDTKLQQLEARNSKLVSDLAIKDSQLHRFADNDRLNPVILQYREKSLNCVKTPNSDQSIPFSQEIMRGQTMPQLHNQQYHPEMDSTKNALKQQQRMVYKVAKRFTNFVKISTAKNKFLQQQLSKLKSDRQIMLSKAIKLSNTVKRLQGSISGRQVAADIRAFATTLLEPLESKVREMVQYYTRPLPTL